MEKDRHCPASFKPTDIFSLEHLGLGSADGLDIYEHDWHVNLCELEQKRHKEVKSQVPGCKLITCGGRGQKEFPPHSSVAVTQWPGAAGWMFPPYFLFPFLWHIWFCLNMKCGIRPYKQRFDPAGQLLLKTKIMQIFSILQVEPRLRIVLCVWSLCSCIKRRFQLYA